MTASTFEFHSVQEEQSTTSPPSEFIEATTTQHIRNTATLTQHQAKN